MPIVRESRVGRAMLLLTILLAVSAGVVLYDLNGWHLPGDALDGAPAGIVSAVGALAPFVILSITVMVLVVEGGSMVSEAFLKRRYEAGREAERAEWERWLERKEAAERDGLAFDEPPPSRRNKRG